MGMARAATTTDAFNAVAEPRRRQILGARLLEVRHISRREQTGCESDPRGLIEMKPEEFANWLETSTSLAKLEHWLQPFGLYKNAQIPILSQRPLITV
jgi:hypothetical protein